MLHRTVVLHGAIIPERVCRSHSSARGRQADRARNEHAVKPRRQSIDTNAHSARTRSPRNTTGAGLGAKVAGAADESLDALVTGGAPKVNGAGFCSAALVTPSLLLGVEVDCPLKSCLDAESLVVDGNENGEGDVLGFASTSGALAPTTCPPNTKGEEVWVLADCPVVLGAVCPPKSGGEVCADSPVVPDGFAGAPNKGEGEPKLAIPAGFELAGIAFPNKGFGTITEGGVDFGVSGSFTDVANEGAGVEVSGGSNFGGVDLGVVDSATEDVLLTRKREFAKKLGTAPLD